MKMKPCSFIKINMFALEKVSVTLRYFNAKYLKVEGHNTIQKSI